MKKIINQLQQNVRIADQVFEESPQPLIFNLADENDRDKFHVFFESIHPVVIRDTYADQLYELVEIRNPKLRENPSAMQLKYEELYSSLGEHETQGRWVYYPWTGVLSHLLDPIFHQELRTARNQLLVTKQEQKVLQEAVVGVGGLSIGNSVALALAHSGCCETMKLADPDRFSISNLNRVRFSTAYVGLKKVYVAAQQIFEANPYANLILYPEGITPQNMEDFIRGDHPIDVLVDELDDLQMKIALRLVARAARLPLLMTTDNGDNSIIDVERFDLGETNTIFDKFPQRSLQELIVVLKSIPAFHLSAQQKVQVSTQIVGAEHAVERMQDSLLEVGNTLYSWPQLGTAALSGGAVLAYAIKKLILGDEIQSGKIQLSLDGLFIKGYDSVQAANARAQHTRRFSDKLATIGQHIEEVSLQKLFKPYM